MNAYAEMAFETAMIWLRDAARPWIVNDGAIHDLRDRLGGDFEKEITDLASWNKWSVPLRRLAQHSGSLAAFIAEADFQAGPGPNYLVDSRHTQLAVALVKWLICPAVDKREGTRGRICSSYLADPQEVTPLQERLKALLAAGMKK